MMVIITIVVMNRKLRVCPDWKLEYSMKDLIHFLIWLHHPFSTLMTMLVGWITEGQRIKDLRNPGLNWIGLIHVDHQLLMAKNVFLPHQHHLHPVAVMVVDVAIPSVVLVPNLQGYLSTY